MAPALTEMEHYDGAVPGATGTSETARMREVLQATATMATSIMPLAANNCSRRTKRITHPVMAEDIGASPMKMNMNSAIVRPSMAGAA